MVPTVIFHIQQSLGLTEQCYSQSWLRERCFHLTCCAHCTWCTVLQT